MSNYGKRGGEGSTRGKALHRYVVTLPDGSAITRGTFDPPADPVGYAYLNSGLWYVAAIADKSDQRFAHYTHCPAIAALGLKP